MKKIACGNSLVDILSLSLLHRQLPHQREPNHRYARRRVPLLAMTLYPPPSLRAHTGRGNLFMTKIPASRKAGGGKLVSNLSVVDKLRQFDRVNDFAVLVNAHIARRDFVDKDNFVVVIPKLEFDIPKVKTDRF